MARGAGWGGAQAGKGVMVLTAMCGGGIIGFSRFKRRVCACHMSAVSGDRSASCGPVATPTVLPTKSTTSTLERLKGFFVTLTDELVGWE